MTGEPGGPVRGEERAREARWRPLSLPGPRPRPPAARLWPAARERPRGLVPKGGSVGEEELSRKRQLLALFSHPPGLPSSGFPHGPSPCHAQPSSPSRSTCIGAAARRDRRAHVGAGILTQPHGGRALAAARYAFQRALLASNRHGRPRHELWPFGADGHCCPGRPAAPPSEAIAPLSAPRMAQWRPHGCPGARGTDSAGRGPPGSERPGVATCARRPGSSARCQPAPQALAPCQCPSSFIRAAGAPLCDGKAS